MYSYRTKRRRIQAEVDSTLREMDLGEHSVNDDVESSLVLMETTSVDSLASKSKSGEDAHVVNDVTQKHIRQAIENSLNSDNSIIPKVTMPNAIAEWAIRNNISHIATTDLLKTLKSCTDGIGTLPLSSKTLLRTPRSIQLESITGGHCYYFGIRHTLVKEINIGLTDFYFPCMAKVRDEIVGGKLITLSVSTDGLPISKSSSIQLWPILYRIDQSLDRKVHLAGLFCGETKPKSLSAFLAAFVNELKCLEGGFKLNDSEYFVRISCIIADAPARSFIKCTKGHTAYHGCERCVDEGEWLGRIIFTNLRAQLRTNGSFYSQLDPDHHTNTSPLIELKIGLVSQVVLDYMHLVCLGIVRKLLNLWISGPLKSRLDSRKTNSISQYLVGISKGMPEEFVRKPRSLSDINRYKATEFRQFLLYTGTCATKDIVSKSCYKNFLCLHAIMVIVLSDKATDPHWNAVAKNLLRKFASDMTDCYGDEAIVYNVHSLIHIADDAQNYGALDSASAFPFESFLNKIKKSIRGQKLHLSQVVKRVIESEAKVFNRHSKKAQENRCMQIANSLELRKVYHNGVCISKKQGNNCFITVDGKIVLVNRVFRNTDNSIVITCREYLCKQNLKHYPIMSSSLNIYNLGSVMSENRNITLSDLSQKCVLLPIDCNDKHVCIPMLQSL